MSLDLLRALKALADETRLRLCLVLQHYELSVNELVSLLEMGQSRVSRHLKILAEAGLAQARRDGLWVFYSAAESGPARELLDSVLLFAREEGQSAADLALARQIIEERALHTRHFFNSIAEDWDELNHHILGDFDLAGQVTAFMPSPCVCAVDLGCGTGEVLAKMRGHCQSMIGVDGSPRMLELARRRFVDQAPELSLRIGELEHLPLRDAEADFACINLVLHHLSQPEAALREAARVLCPESFLLLVDFDRHQSEEMRQVYGDHWLGFTKDELENMLLAAGLRPCSYQDQPVTKGLRLHLILAHKEA